MCGTPARAPVHPHARGERKRGSEVTPFLIGSSPRTWGTQQQRKLQADMQRFIPTHVGNAPPWCTWPVLAAVHPHARGERVQCALHGAHPGGSSPRTWGTLGLAVCFDQRLRFIPTHVGNALCLSVQTRSPAVHPHARGERFERPGVTGLGVGSSPRTWGTLDQFDTFGRCVRFIPTHVGNAFCTRNTRWGATVHPHARGERYQLKRGTALVIGSSPRTWGTRSVSHDHVRYRRFTPTHVGNA